MEKTIEDRLREREARIAAKAAAVAGKRDEDLGAWLDLCEKRGDDDAIKVEVSGDRIVVIRKPTRAEVQRWREGINAEGRGAAIRKASANVQLGKCCVLYPPDYESICDQYAGVEDIVALAAVEAAGLVIEERTGKR